MSATLSKFDSFKLTTRFGEGYCEHTIPGEPGTGSGVGQGGRTEKWTKGELIGSGRFGKVFLENDGKGGVRAVKQIPRTNKVLGSSKMQVFHSRELQALTEMNTYPEHFVKFFGWYEDTENIYFAMEFIGFGNLAELIGSNGMAEDDAKIITTQLLKGLEVMHENKFCHRDLKPENILIASKSPIIVKISDFGTSKQSVDDTVFRTFAGTNGYIAPEIWGYISHTGPGGYDYPVDIWSLGCLVYAILTADTPFGVTSTHEFIEYVRNRIPFPTTKLNEKKASRAAIGFITSLMMPLPEDRLTAKQALDATWLNGGSDDINEDNPEYTHERDTALSDEVDSEEDIFYDIEATHQCTTLACAIAHQNVSAARQLCPWGETTMSIREGDNRTLLHKCAVLGGDAEEISRLLLERGADVMARDELEWTALHHAAKEGQAGMAQLLLERGADTMAKDGLGWTPLHRATKEGHQEMINLLIEKGADIDAAENELGSTPLHLAVKEGNLTVVELLLSKGARVRAKDGLGNTACHLAAVSEHKYSVVIIKLLFAKGAILGEKNKEGKTPLSLAPQNKELQRIVSDELVRFFRRLG